MSPGNGVHLDSNNQLILGIFRSQYLNLSLSGVYSIFDLSKMKNKIPSTTISLFLRV